MKSNKPFIFIVFVILVVGLFSFQAKEKNTLPEGFVYLTDYVPNAVIELRYCYDNNFIGTSIDGYIEEKCIVTKEAAVALQKIQKILNQKQLGIKVFDAYRPQRAVDHFRIWARDLKDTLMKSKFYPEVAKRDLFKLEYIATRSRHSSGSTVDITLVDLTTGIALDMGSSYDYFGEISWVAYENLTKEQLQNRSALQQVMNANGFRSYPQEWWHFTLRGEPYRNQYFDFVVE